jgi:nicotinate-nucleotide adenylyltransferase
VAAARSGSSPGTGPGGGIGLFGGTFDPIHVAHLRAAEEVREAERLDEVRFVPAALPPHKEAGGIALAAHRLHMVELAVAGSPGLRAWDVELGRTGPSYSVDTVRALRAEVGPDTRIALILGRDAFDEFHTWRDPGTILTLCDVIVMTRPPWSGGLSLDDVRVAGGGGFRYDAASGTIRHASGRGVSLQRITALDISASAIRALVSARRSIRFLVTPAVESYIREHDLYRAEDQPS